jgi:hypothetical protein
MSWQQITEFTGLPAVSRPNLTTLAITLAELIDITYRASTDSRRFMCRETPRQQAIRYFECAEASFEYGEYPGTTVTRGGP